MEDPILYPEFSLRNRAGVYAEKSPEMTVETEEVPTAPVEEPGVCKICDYPINGEAHMAYSCGHSLHRVCAGRLQELGTTYLFINCYDCHYKGKGIRLNYNEDTINDRTLSFKQWSNLIGLKAMMVNEHKNLTITKLMGMGVNMEHVLHIGVGFSNLTANLVTKPRFSEMVEFGMVKEVFKLKKYRHLIPLNRVISYFRLTIKSLRGKYKEIFHFDVNDLPAMGADRTTLKILNLDAHLLAVHGATTKTIKDLKVSNRSWVEDFNATPAMLALWGMHE